MNETSILHLAGGKVTLQARRAVNQSKKPANGKIMFVLYIWIICLFICYLFYLFIWAVVRKTLYLPQAERLLRLKLRPRA
jgi:hypothetical protein